MGQERKDRKPAAEFENRLLWASRVADQKRPNLVAAIGRSLHARRPRLTIDVFGSTDDVNAAHQLLKCPAVKTHGAFSSLDALSPQSYPLFLYTSSFDGVPIILLEAMAHGLPIIAPRLCGIPEIVTHGETGWLIDTTGDDESDAVSYLAAIDEALCDRSKLRRMGQAARARIESDFSEKYFLRRVDEIFAD